MRTADLVASHRIRKLTDRLRYGLVRAGWGTCCSSNQHHVGAELAGASRPAVPEPKLLRSNYDSHPANGDAQ